MCLSVLRFSIYAIKINVRFSSYNLIGSFTLMLQTRCSEKYCYACQRIVAELVMYLIVTGFNNDRICGYSDINMLGVIVLQGGTSLLPATLVNSSSELQ